MNPFTRQRILNVLTYAGVVILIAGVIVVMIRVAALSKALALCVSFLSGVVAVIISLMYAMFKNGPTGGG